jgi:uncharacterized iron-regulated membrane protein
VIEVFDPGQFSVAEKILAWQHAVHAAQGLGWAWKILVFLCGLLPLLFVVNGVTMWRLKRGRRTSPAGARDLFLDQVESARRAGE